jgi:capsular polysaccharide biosynthesis protein
MELNEALHRVVVGHWRLLLVLTLLPVLVVVGLQLRSHPGYAATSRVQVSDQTPTTTTEADAVLSRAQAIATSTSIVQRAIWDAHLTGHVPADFAHEIKLSRIGTSAVVNLTVTDRSPAVATGLDSGLAKELANYLNGGPKTTADTALINQLTAQEHSLLAQRSQLAAQLALAQSPADHARLSAQLGSVDQQLGGVQSLLSGLNPTTAAVIAAPTGAGRAHSALVTDAVLAGLLGLVTGLLAATVLETLRPRVADAEAFSREIGAPLLGAVRLRGGRRHPQQLVVPGDTLISARRAVARSRVESLLLTGPDPDGRLALVAREFEALLTPAQQPGHGGEHSTLNGAGTGHRTNLRAADEWGVSVDGVGQPGTQRLMEAAEPAGATALLRVRALADLPGADRRGDDRREGLLVVVPDLAPHREVRRIRQLADSTGWPVVGVLGLAAKDREHKGS